MNSIVKYTDDQAAQLVKLTSYDRGVKEVPLRRKCASGKNEELNYAAAATIHSISAGLRTTG